MAELLIAAAAAGGVGAVPSAMAGQKGDVETKAHAVIDNNALADRVKKNIANGSYRELEPAMVTDYASLAKVASDAGHRGKPRIFQDIDNHNSVPVVYMDGKLEGRPIIIANSAAIKVTPEYAKAYAVVSAEEMRSWVLASKAGMPKEVSDAFAKLSAKQGLPKPPPVYLDRGDTSPIPRAETAFTYKGETVIVLNRAKMQQKPNELLGSLAHEGGHVVNKDLSAEKLAATTNDPALSRAVEDDADKQAKHLCRPADLADSLETAMAARARRSMQLTPGLSQADALNRLAETRDTSSHKSFRDRVKGIRELPENTPGCVSIPPEGGRKR